jgi:hypothetical protein
VQNSNLATSTFNTGGVIFDTLTPLSVSLDPGDYAMVSGSGLFGAAGQADMTEDGTDTPAGVGSHFIQTVFSGWQDNGFRNTHFVVEATPRPPPSTVPELSSIVILGIGSVPSLGMLTVRLACLVPRSFVRR